MYLSLCCHSFSSNVNILSQFNGEDAPCRARQEVSPRIRKPSARGYAWGEEGSWSIDVGLLPGQVLDKD